MEIGLGGVNATFCVYVEHAPKLAPYNSLSSVTPLLPNEIAHIGNECGNGWRKIFNVYSKLVFEFDQENYRKQGVNTWQALRDKHLLQQHDCHALLFSAPNLSATNKYHIIAGRTYAKKLTQQHARPLQLIWLDEEFAIDQEHNVIVCPFFDYRQLSNVKITYLVSLIKSLGN